MSDLVKEAAPLLSPTTDSSNQAVNKRKLLALSSRGTSAGGFSSDQTSLLVDAFAEVFASMAISSPTPIESSSSISKVEHTGEEVAEDAGHPEESVQNDSEQSVVDNTDNGSENAVSAEFAIQSQVANSGDSEEGEDTEDVSLLGATIEAEASDETSEFETENESTEAAQLAVAATISQTADEIELGGEADPQNTTNDDSVDSQPAVAPVEADSSKPVIRQVENAEASQAETDDPAGLQGGQQANEHNGDQSESESRRRYSKDDKTSNERSAIAASGKPASESKPTASALQQSSGPTPNLAPHSPAAGHPPAVPSPTATAIAAAAAVSSVSNASGAALSAASRAAAGSSGIASSVNSADGARLLTGTEHASRPELASNSKSAKKSDASTNQAETLNRIKLVQRVSRAFQHLGPEGGVVRLRLAPVELGTVRVEMQIQQKKVNARVVAETEAASNALREHLPELRARLEEHGMQIESLEVETQADDGASSTMDHRSQQEASRRQSSRRGENRSRQTREADQPIAAPVSRQPVSLASSGGVDIRL